MPILIYEHHIIILKYLISQTFLKYTTFSLKQSAEFEIKEKYQESPLRSVGSALVTFHEHLGNGNKQALLQRWTIMKVGVTIHQSSSFVKLIKGHSRH